MCIYEANYEFIKMKEIFKEDPEWEKAFALFHCLTIRDKDTSQHSIEVAYYSAKVAEKLNLNPSRYFLAGMLHDIGKIGMDDHPLKSEKALTKKERLQLADHVLNGVLTLSDLRFGRDVVQFCLRHHERLNGSGYPFGVDENNTSIEGKIAQVVDVFSAMTNPRKYREKQKVYSPKDALAIMENETMEDNAFDSSILNILKEIVTDEFKEKRQYA